jgi:hypothetical protein
MVIRMAKRQSMKISLANLSAVTTLDTAVMYENEEPTNKCRITYVDFMNQ